MMTTSMTARRAAGALAVAVLLLTGCSSTKPQAGPSAGASGAEGTAKGGNAFFDQKEFDRQRAEQEVAPQGDRAEPWLQAINPTYVDTGRYAKPGGKWRVCFSNAGVGNPWRVTGLTTMKAEAKLHPEISSFTVADAQSQDDKQISDISDLLAKGCDVLIVSPNTTAALTPAVTRACQSGVPVVVFDRGVTTKCPVTFVHGIGGYAFGATAAQFIAQHMKPGGNVLALRILPGVDVLENRWAAAKLTFEQAKVKVRGAEF